MQTIIQITDLHIDNNDPELALLSPEDNFSKFLLYARNIPFDKLVVTGDVADANESFEIVMNKLQELCGTIRFVSGNHDPKEAFHLSGLKKPYFVEHLEEFLVLYLDSGMGKIDNEQLLWMEEQLLHNEKDILIFLHHPIIDCGNTVMDRMFPLLNRDEVCRILDKTKNKISIFSGHYHWEQEIHAGNRKQYVTPSLLYQLDQNSDSLKIGSTNFGFRVINITKDCIETYVEYI